MSRKKKLKFIQLSLLTLSILMIFFAYFNKFSPEGKNIISKQEQQNMFYNENFSREMNVRN